MKYRVLVYGEERAEGCADSIASPSTVTRARRPRVASGAAAAATATTVRVRDGKCR